MLKVFFNNTPDSINKLLKLTWILTKTDLKFVLGNEAINVILYFSLILLQAKQGGIFEKNGFKSYLILTFSSGSSKMVFILLQVVIVL